MTTLIIANKNMNDITKIVNSFQDADLLIKVVSETIKNEAKQQKSGFLGMLLVTLVASLLGSLITVKDLNGQKYLDEE